MTGDPILLADALGKSPPNSVIRVSDVTKRVPAHAGGTYSIVNNPDIVMHCDNDICRGDRVYRSPMNGSLHLSTNWMNYFLTYTCSNCNLSVKVFATSLRRNKDGDGGEIFKYGEVPTFGPPIPSKAISLVGPDRDLFLKGRTAENQGLGIAALAYYRRIIENQWQRLLGEIIKVAKKTGFDQDLIDVLDRAKGEYQFKKAVESIGEAIPPSLQLNGHNPLTLLYAALSEGVHSLSDEECLEIAHSVRTIIYELADKLGSALKEQGELETAINKLAARKQKK